MGFPTLITPNQERGTGGSWTHLSFIGLLQPGIHQGAFYRFLIPPCSSSHLSQVFRFEPGVRDRGVIIDHLRGGCRITVKCRSDGFNGIGSIDIRSHKKSDGCHNK